MSQSAKSPLPQAAVRALKEAQARREANSKTQKPAPKELNGPKGLDPARYGDWERKGIISDF